MTAGARRAVQWTVTAGFFAVVLWFLGDELRALDVGEVAAALREMPAEHVAAAFALTAVCYAIVAAYDRLASHYAGVRLPAAIGFAIAFVSYAFNFNVGAIVGAWGFRLRLYSREGIDASRIAAIAACSIVTNWCGCLSVLGAVLIADPSAVRMGWEVSAVAGRLLGALALAPVAAYLIANAVGRPEVRIRGSRYRLPGPRFALAQIALGSAYWLLAPLVIGMVAPAAAAIRYTELVAAFALAAVSGVVIRVPAGLGVIEAVFLEVFRGRVGAGAVLGMLIAWRAVFLLVPLCVAAVALAALEFRGGAPRARRRGRAQPPANPPGSHARAG